MPPLFAAVVVVVGILGLFLLDGKGQPRSSWALWLPVVWLLISGSRHVSTWLDMTPAASPEQYLEGSPLDRAIYALLLAMGIVVLLGRQRAVAGLLRRNWPILLFVLYCGVSVIWSDYPGVTLKRLVKSLGDYVMVLIVLTEPDILRALKQVLARVGFVLLPLSILFIKYFPNWGRAYATHWEGTQFFLGVADTKNMLGMTCMVFGFAACWRVLNALTTPRREGRRILIVHGAVVAMAIWLLKTSDSKTSLICFTATSGLIAAHTFFRTARRRRIVHVMVAAVVLSSFSVLFLGIGSGFLETVGRNSTLTGRTDIWDILLQVPINPFLGTGFESFWLGDRLKWLWTFSAVNGINEAHNGYLEVYLNLGAVGLLLIGSLMVTGYRNVLRLLDQQPELGRLSLGYFVITLTYNFTEAGIRSTDLVWIAFLLATFWIPTRPSAREAVAKSRPVARTLAEVEQVV